MKRNNEFVGATLDRSQAVKFYYGNAARDLHDKLPREEDLQGLSEVWDSLAQTERLLFQLNESHAKLSFLMGDLRRLIK